MDKLAINGAEPVRKNPFPPNYLGVSLYDGCELAQITDVINNKCPNRFYTHGLPSKTDMLEQKFCEYFSRRYALAVSSGTGALICSMAALGLGPGDEIILPAFGWISDYAAIISCGALPVFADIDESLNLDPLDFERKITKNTKAVLMVYFQGGQGDLDSVLKIAAKHDIAVIEDAAQALGGEYRGKKLGSFGKIAILSLQQNKMLCCGEGGAVLTDDENLFVRAVRYHDLGMVRPVFADRLRDKSLCGEALAFSGNQYHMNELSGAVMLAQMSKLDGLLDKCRSYHAEIREGLKECRRFTLRWADGDCGVTAFLRFATADEAKRFQDCLSAEGIPLGPKSACKNLAVQNPVVGKRLAHEALPPFGKGFGGEFTDYARINESLKTDAILARNVAISIGPQYTGDDIGDIVRAVKKVYEALYGRGA